MPSVAHYIWHHERQRRIYQLLHARQSIGRGPGGRWRTEQLNWALILRLAGEFQGYGRELHDLAVEHFVDNLALSNSRLADVIETSMTRERKLDKGNAHPGALGDDFGRFGIVLWDELRQAHSRGDAWNRDLTALYQARNAIAHAEIGKLADLRQRGYPITLDTIRRWRTSLDGLVGAMDDVVSEYLDLLMGTGRPW